LFSLYYPRLFKFVYRFANSCTLADELVNDIMLLVWRKASTFRGDSKVSTWIFGIAYRQTMQRITRKRQPPGAAVAVEDLADETNAELRLEAQDWVASALDQLPPPQQLSVVLVFYLGLSYEETAAVTDCPVNTVKTRMFHARRKLKQLLSEPVRQSLRR
ncbi:MAG: RNA polymerase sigma factor, partial [Pseudomonadota bacterium]